jgi:ATP-binding cassette subfamily B protein
VLADVEADRNQGMTENTPPEPVVPDKRDLSPRGGRRAHRESRAERRSRGARRDSTPDQPPLGLTADIRLMTRLVGMSLHYWPNVLGLFLLGLAAAPLALLGPLPMKIAVDSVIGSKPLPRFIQPLVPEALRSGKGALLGLAAGLIIATVFFRQLTDMATLLLRTVTGEKLLLETRSRLFRHVQRMSLSYHDSQGTADSIYRLQYDTPAIQNLVIDSLISFVSASITFASMVYVTVLLDWQLALLAMTVTPLLVVIGHFSRRFVRTRSREVKQIESDAMSVVQEVLTALRVVKAFGQEEREGARFVQQSRKGMQARIHLAVFQGSLSLMRRLAMSIGVAIVMVVGVRHVQSGELSLGSLILVMGYLTQLYAPLRTMTQKVSGLQDSLTSAERVLALLDHAPDVPEHPNARPLVRARGALTFRGVGFVYGDGRPVLHDISFDIAPGTRLGIVGATGAGKTTLVSLLTRFYDPTSGAILLDDVDLREYRLVDLRNQFAIVLQEPILFSTSIAENIAYARPEATESEVMAAAKAANIHDFVRDLPKGYDTLVGERGMQLSGGERQRVALARAFLRDAPILILDEPTSSVDTKTEAVIVEAMERLVRGRTSIMVAHRVTTLRDCNLLLTIDQGRVVSVRSDVIAAIDEMSAFDRKRNLRERSGAGL